jgi:tRNA-guanine family transglycosylase
MHEAKITEILLRGKSFAIPNFIPSISGASPSLSSVSDVKVILDVLRKFNATTALVSIYDLIRQKSIFEKYYKRCIQEKIGIHEAFDFSKDMVLFMDSGGYELQSVGAKLQDWDDPYQIYVNQSNLRPDIIVILDKPVQLGSSKQEKKSLIEENIQITKRIAKSKTSRIPLMAVAHGYDVPSLISTVRELSHIDGLDFIAVSDKEFDGFHPKDVISYIHQAKKEISSSSSHLMLHVLAAGEISNWPFYVAAGANTFDSTCWIDEIAHSDEMRWLSRNDDVLMSTTCNCSICQGKQMPIKQIISEENTRLLHNLHCIAIHTESIRIALDQGNLLNLASSANRELLDLLDPAMCKLLFSSLESS